jgi:arginine transport system substrate-binding protein
MKQFITSIIAFAVMTGCIAFIYHSKSEKKPMEQQLVVGTNSGFPPYEFIDETGKIVGFDIDLAQEIATQMNKKLVVEDMSFDALILALDQGKIDIAIAGISITPNRMEKVSMVHYIGQGLTSLPLAFWEKIPEEVSQIEDFKKLKNKTIAAQVGNIQEEFISKFDFIEIQSLDTYTDLIMSIKYGKAIACVLEPLVVEKIKKQHPQIKILEIPLGPEDKNEGNGICIKKTNALLTRQIQEIVSKLKRDGTMEKLNKKWFIN